MTTSHDFSQLKAIAKQSQVILNSQTLNGHFQSALDNYYYNQGQIIEIDGIKDDDIVIDETNQLITITGRASYFNIPNLVTTLTLWLDKQSQAQFKVHYELIKTRHQTTQWRFSNSFDNLPLKTSNNLLGLDKFTGQYQITPFLDDLDFAQAAYVVTSYDNEAQNLVTGINFVGKIMPLGFLGLMQNLLPIDVEPVDIYGEIVILSNDTKMDMTELYQDIGVSRYFPWEMGDYKVPGIHLKIDLPLDFKLGKTQLDETFVRFYTPYDQSLDGETNMFSPMVALTGLFTIPSADLAMDLVCDLDPTANVLNFEGRFDGFTLENLAKLADMFGAGGLNADLPDVFNDALKPLEQLELQSLGFQVSWNKGLSFDQIRLGIGMDELNWQIWPKHIEVTEIGTLFTIKQPFGQYRDTEVQLWGKTIIEGTNVDIQAVKRMGQIQFMTIIGGTTFPLKKIMKTFTPKLPAPANLSIDRLKLVASPGNFYQFMGSIASEPNQWELNLGPTKLEIKNITFDLMIEQQDNQHVTSGSFSGELDIGKNITIATNYNIPGEFVIRGEVNKLVFSELLSKLTNQPINLPKGLDFTLLDASVMIKKQSSGLVFQLAAMVEGFGYLAFEVKKTGGKWGAAAGISLDAGMKLSDIPGLKLLKPVEKIVLMEDFTLVLSSYDGPQFRFPDMAAFANPVLPTANITLPAQSGGVVKGLNSYGKWQIDNSGKQGKLLRKLLGLDPTVTLTAQISSPIQEKSSFYTSIDTTINKDCPFVGQLGVAFNQGTPEFFASANTTVKIGGRKCNFDMTMSFVSTGSYFTGSMIGTVKAGGLQLSNLVLMTGLSYAGVPSLGIAATIDIKDISSSIALFFDGNDPSKSVFAGAISDISLADITNVFANVKRLPSGIGDVLEQINLSGTGEFTMPESTTKALDGLDLDEVSSAFSRHGGINLIGSDMTLSLVVKTPGKKWSLTDLADMMKHYSIEKTRKGIVVTLDAQVYVAPQSTKIGALTFNQGMLLNGKLTVLNQAATCHIEVNRSKGIVIDAQLKRALIIYKQKFFCLKASSSQLKKTSKVNPGNKGALVSIATINQPKHKVRQFRKPHIHLDGELSMMGLIGNCYVTITSGGCQFDLSIVATRKIRITGISGTINENLALTGDFTQINSLSASVASSFDCKLNLNLGEQGKTKFNGKVSGSVAISFDGRKARASFAGSFKFQGVKANIKVGIGVDSDDLKNISKIIAKEVKNECIDVFKDANRWAKAVKNGIMDGVKGVEQTSKILQKHFKQDAKAAAKTLKSAGHSMDSIGKNLKSVYKLSSKDMNSALKGAGYATSSVEKYVSSSYKDATKKVENTAKSVGKKAKKKGKKWKKKFK